MFCRLASVVVCNTPRRAVIRLEVASPAQARKCLHAASSLIIDGGPVVLRPVTATPCFCGYALMLRIQSSLHLNDVHILASVIVSRVCTERLRSCIKGAGKDLHTRRLHDGYCIYVCTSRSMNAYYTSYQCTN